MNVFVNKQLLSYQNCFVVLSRTCHKNGLKAVFSFTDRQHAARQLSFESGPAVVCVDLLWCVWTCYGVCGPAMVCVCGPAMVCVDLLTSLTSSVVPLIKQGPSSKCVCVCVSV